MDNKEKVFEEIQSLLNTQNFGVLATQGVEYPYCTLVCYAASNDGQEIVFATIRDTRKYKNIKKMPKVSLLIDTQTNQVNDFKNAQALTVLGTAQEVDSTNAPDYLSLFLKKHPYLKEFVTIPNCAVIKVSVSKYILVNNFQNVIEYNAL